jgi:hypothetical protein
MRRRPHECLVLLMRAITQARRLAWSASPSTANMRRALEPTADRSMTPDGTEPIALDEDAPTTEGIRREACH